jgi:surfactin synthase thioesterase subunit
MGINYELTEEQKRVLSPEDQQNFLDAMADFKATQERCAADPSLRSDPMPEGKADFPPLGIDADDKPRAIKDLI